MICISMFLEEARGVGGIFFDDLDDGKQDDLFKFVTVSHAMMRGFTYRMGQLISYVIFL